MCIVKICRIHLLYSSQLEKIPSGVGMLLRAPLTQIVGQGYFEFIVTETTFTSTWPLS